jgi:hypothetical protein
MSILSIFIYLKYIKNILGPYYKCKALLYLLKLLLFIVNITHDKQDIKFLT